MRPIALVTFSALLFSAITNADAYKCESEDGRVSYQSEPCEDTMAQTHIEGLKAGQPEATITPRESELIRLGKVATGMSERALLLSWGRPDDVRRSSFGPEQWIYERGGARHQYIYVDDGVVVDWQD